MMKRMPCFPAIAIDASANVMIFSKPRILFIFEPPQNIEKMLGKLPPKRIVPIGVNVSRGNSS